MPRPRFGRRGSHDLDAEFAATGGIKIHFQLRADDARQFLEFMRMNEYPTQALAAHVLFTSAMAAFPKFGILAKERRYYLAEFQQWLRTEVQGFNRQLSEALAMSEKEFADRIMSNNNVLNPGAGDTRENQE